MTKRERLQFWFIWLALGVLPLFLRPLWEPDEGRYAEIPREMLAFGDWLTPRLNHVLYFEKPPFQYWLSAGSMRLFGISAWASRLPLALASLLAMWSAYRLARRLGAVVPVWAAFMAASGFLGFICGQILTLDALFAALLVTAVMALVEAVHTRLERGHDLPWIVLGHLSVALALLTKGLAAPVLVGGMIVISLVFAWRDVDLRKAVLRAALHPAGLVVLLAVSVPWFVLVDQANPGHARFFFIHEHWERFTSHAHARQGHKNPLLDKLYFVGILAVGLLPWLSASVVGAWRAIRFLRPKGPQTVQGPRLRWTASLLLAAIVVPFAFFSLSGSKLPTYILPVVVPFAALAAAFEETHEVWKSLKRVGWELLFLGGLFLIGLPLGVKDGALPLTQVDPRSLSWMLAIGSAFVLLGLWALRPRGLTGGRWMLAHGAVLVLLTLTFQRLGGARKTVDHLVAKAPANAQWISHGNYFQGIAFYTGKRTTVINGTGELRFGSEQLKPEERNRWFQEEPASLNVTAQRMRTEDPSRPVWAILDRDSWKTLSDDTKARWEHVARTPSSHLARFKD